MPTLSVSNFNIVCATLGGFITLFGLVSYLLKENFYLSEARKYNPSPTFIRTNHGCSNFARRWADILASCDQLHKTA